MGLLVRKVEGTWIVVSKWGKGAVVFHQIDRIPTVYPKTYQFYRLKYGIPLYRRIIEQIGQLRHAKNPMDYYGMLPSPLSPFGIAIRWKKWIQETDSTMLLFTKAVLGKPTRKICAEKFFQSWLPILKKLERDPWKYSRAEVEKSIEYVVVDLHQKMYQKFFSSFWEQR